MKTRPGRDEGAMLVIAILVITTIAVVAGALLARSGSNLSATVNLRQVAGSAYAADAAAKVAINNLEQGGSNTSDSGAYYPATSTVPSNQWVFNKSDDGTGCFGKNS